MTEAQKFHTDDASLPRSTMEDKRTWDCVKSPSKQLLRRTLLLRTIFCSALDLYRRPPTSPSNNVAKKSTHFHPFCSKFNFVWGGRGGVTSFSNITGKVPTLLTSIVGSASDWSCHVQNLLQPIKGITQIWVVTRHQ